MAQLAEQLTRNEQVAGSNPATSSKKATPDRVLLFLLSLSGVEVYPPSRGKSGHKLQLLAGIARHLSALRWRYMYQRCFSEGLLRCRLPLCAAAHTSETATRYIAHEMPISGHNCRSMRNYRGGISVKWSISSREHHFLSNAVAGCRTKMLVFDKLPLHLLSVCGIFDSVKAVRGVYMGNCVPLKLC